MYWGNPSPSGWGGAEFDDPVELSVRWEDRREMFIDMSGNEVASSAVVFLGQDVEIGGYLYLGELSDLDSTVIAPAGVTTGRVYEIRGFAKSPTVSGKKYVRKAWL